MGFQQITHLINSKGFHSPMVFFFNLSNEEVMGSEGVINLDKGILLLPEPFSTGVDRRRNFVKILGFIFGHTTF